jgi:hypothetical protein
MKNKIASLSITTLLAIFAAVGCTSKATKENLNEKVSAESHVTTPADLHAEVKDAIIDAKNLSPDQKEKLSALRDETHTKLESYHQEALRLESVLAKDIVSPKYNISEVKLIKQRMRKLETQRLDLIFDTVDKANLIMGRQALNNEEVLHSMYGTGSSRF